MNASYDNPRIALLLTGNELMTGDIVDSNSSMIATDLLEHGYAVELKVTVGDSMTALCSELSRLAKEFDVVLMNGGLGPTEDDLTADACAQVMNVAIEQHPNAYEHLEKIAETGLIRLNGANLKQAMLPAGCETLDNPVGTALGFAMQIDGALVMCSPGVPSELKQMLSGQMLPRLQERFPSPNRPMRHRLKVFGFGESHLQQLLAEEFPDWPDWLEQGFRASMPMLELKLQISDDSRRDQLEDWSDKIRAKLGAHVVTDEDQTMAESLVALLNEKGKRFTCAESCTGGLIASNMTSVAGVSNVFEAGYVTYSNQAKEDMLAVKHSTLENNGAVSEPVVIEMLTGALNKSGADVGVSVSGIAGPAGGTEEKPVGTVCIAWGSLDDMRVVTVNIPGLRHRFQAWVTAMAMDLVRRFLLEVEEEPFYIVKRRFSIKKSPV